jgi:hypothetical protein
MADLNSEELQQAIRELTESLNGLGATSRNNETAFQKELKARGLSTEAAQQASQTLDALGRTAVKLTSQLYKGQQGMGVFAEAVDDAASAIGALTFLMGGPLVKALTVLTLGFVKLGRISAEMSDSLFKSYQSISRSGAAAADGLQGVFSLMQDLRLSTEELDQLNSIVAENAQAFALFQGTVYDGARSFGALRKSITTSGLEREFMGLGMNTQEINETLSGYISLQSRLGIQQVRDTNKITASINQYVAETDAITKLTGATRRQQEEAQQKALAVEQFRFRINELVAKGDEASLKEANRLTTVFKGLNALDPELALGFAQTVTGFVTDAQGIGSFLVTNAKSLEVANNRSLTFGQSMELLGDAVRENIGPQGAFGQLAAFGGFGQTLNMNYGALSDFALITKDASGKVRDITDLQEAQRKASETGLSAQIDTRISQINSMQAMQAFVELGVNPATVALSGLAKVAETITSFLPKSGGEAVAGAAGGVGGAIAGAKTGAAVGTLGGGPIGTAVGGILGGIAGYFGGKAIGGMFGGPRPEDVLEFGERSGGRAAFEQLDSNLQQRILAAGEQYMAMTGGPGRGRKLKINSAFRSREEQERLYALYQSGRGLPAAPPGSSLHEQGLAVDIQNYNDPAAVAALNRQGLRQTVRGDPPHFAMQEGYLTGGIATGPRSGYTATLHGTEAVVPLPDGKTIPVEMPAMQSEMGRQVGLMGDQIARLDELIGLMRDNNSISTKILQHSVN